MDGSICCPDCGVCLDFDSHSNSFYDADVCCVSCIEFFGDKKWDRSDRDLSSDGNHWSAGVFQFYFWDWSASGNAWRIYDRLDFFWFGDGSCKEIIGQKTLGTGSFHGAWIGSLLCDGNCLVFVYLFWKDRGSGTRNSTALVCSSLYFSGSDKIRIGSLDESETGTDTAVAVSETG